MKPAVAAVVVALILTGQARAQMGRIEIKATGSASAPVNWEPSPGGPPLQDLLRVQAIGRAMQSARAQAEGIAEAGGMKLGGVLSVEILPDAPHHGVSLTNAGGDSGLDGRRIYILNQIGTEFSRGASASSAEITVDVEYAIGK